MRAALTAGYWVGDTGSNQWCPAVGELPNTTDFNNFIAAISQSRINLNGLQTGLSGVASDVSNCPYYPDDNLDNMGSFIIGNFRYVVNGGGYNQPCGLEAIPEGVFAQYGWRVLGSILGTQAGAIDNLPHDLSLWFKPTNTVVAELVKDGASDLWNAVMEFSLLPFAAFASIFSKHNILETSKNWSHSTNPVDYIDSWTPGIPYPGDATSFNGLWHFIESSPFPGPRGQYNNPSGMYYPNAGPNFSPGVLDDLILDGSTLSGLSLNARSSDGVSNYGQFDDDTHNWAKWQAHSIGLTEFSPVDNMARYGQKVYDGNMGNGGHLSAYGLGWALHALGDASVPEHSANSTSWGHRPLEDAINNVYPAALRFDTVAPQGSNPVGQDYFTDCHRAVEIVLKAYTWWQQYKMGDGNHIDLADFVPRVAMNGRLWTNAHQNVYQDDLSYTYQFISESDATDAYQSWSDFGGNEHTLADFAGPLLVESAGAILAYLIDAGELVGTQQSNPNTKCQPNTHFVHLQGCQPGPGKGTPPTASMFVVNNCSASGQSCTANGDCCSGLTCGTSGSNAGICSLPQPGGGLGASCSSKADCQGSDIVCGSNNKCCIDFTNTPCQSASDCCPNPGTGDMTGVVCINNLCGFPG